MAQPRTLTVFVTCLTLACLSAGCLSPRPTSSQPGKSNGQTASLRKGAPKGVQPLTLLHTNDGHSSFAAEPATWQADKALIGGFEMLEATTRRIRSEVPNTLLLDAGDMSTGNPLSQIPVDGIRGLKLFELMNLAGYNAWTLGNHDFDLGQENLFQLLSRLKFPTVCANLTSTTIDLPKHGIVPSVVLDAGPLKVGVIGIMTEGLSKVSSRSNIEGLTVIPATDALEAELKRLDPLTDVLVVLSHAGDEADKTLAAQVPGIDVIIGGHSHQRLYPPVQVGKTLVVQAGSNLHYLGRLDLQVKDDEVVSFNGELIPLWVRPDVSVSAEMRQQVQQAQTLVEAEFSRPVGELKVAWNRNYYGESNVGNWLTDQMRLWARADVAFLNSGGIRKDLPAGKVTRGDLLSVLPFDNPVWTFKLTGAQLTEVARANAQAGLGQKHGVLQVSGLRYRWRNVSGKAELVEITVGGQPVVPEKLYMAVTTEFMLISQPEKYFPGVTPVDSTRLSSLVDVIQEAFEKAKTVDSMVDGRITEAKEAR